MIEQFIGDTEIGEAYIWWPKGSLELMLPFEREALELYPNDKSKRYEHMYGLYKTAYNDYHEELNTIKKKWWYKLFKNL